MFDVEFDIIGLSVYGEFDITSTLCPDVAAFSFVSPPWFGCQVLGLEFRVSGFGCRIRQITKVGDMSAQALCAPRTQRSPSSAHPVGWCACAGLRVSARKVDMRLPEKGNSIAQGRSSKTISKIKWILTSRLSIKNLSLHRIEDV